MAVTTPNRLPRIRRDIPAPENEPFLDLPEPPPPSPRVARAPSSPERSRLGRTPTPPISRGGPSAPRSVSRLDSTGRPPPISGAAAQSARTLPDDDDDAESRRSAYSLRARDLPLSVARRSVEPRAAGETAVRPVRAEDTTDRQPRPPSRPALEGALPVPRPPGPAISPRMTAIFGGLFGLAAITSVVAVLIQAAPPKDDRAAMAQTAAASATSAPAAAPPVKSRKPKREALPGPWRIKEMEKDPHIAMVTGLMEKKSFIDALDEKKIPKAQAYRILKAFESVRKFDRTGKKDRFTVALEKGSQRIKAFEYEVNPTEVYQAKEDAQGLLVGQKLDMKIAENEFAGAFYVQKDITKSFEEGGFEPGILATIDEALVGRMSCDSFDEGGTVRVIALEETALGLFARYKRVLALEYKPADPGAKPLRIYYYNGTDSKGYWDDKGRQMYGGGFQKPVPGAPITSKFNPKRMHPVLHRIMPHQGTDFGAPTGTPVYSSYKGTIQFVGNGGPAGNLVTVLHANGVETGYAHLSRFAPGIKIGDKVGTKQLVGYVGSTGRSTGPHLHFSAKKNGQFFDAETLLAIDKERVLPPEERQAFMAFKAEIDKRLDAIELPPPPPPPAPVVAANAATSGPSLLPASAMPTGIAAPLQPTIHPSGFIEDDGDDDEGGEAIPGAMLGAPGAAPAPSPAPKTPSKTDPSEDDDSDH
ncbi:MAG: peptidoglycan DD-metalloendopeptidase family protein [Polyangiaceae bacterium]|nr:peptidoglycan DD-metalloendopeptidase family protein [Polyangiaceae bacterium]